MRILVAEDDPRVLKSLVHILKINNYSADGVSNGNDAFDYARTGEYDGLVLDIMMPAQMIICPNPFPRRNCWRACGPCCAEKRIIRRICFLLTG